MAKEHTPTFQDWNMLLDNDSSTSMQARKLAIGTSGYAISRVMLRVTGYTIEGGSDLQMHIKWVLFIMDLSQGIIAGHNASHPRQHQNYGDWMIKHYGEDGLDHPSQGYGLQ